MQSSNQALDYDLEVWTEGKSDWKILKRAFKELDTSLRVRFHEHDGDMGDSKLFNKCSTFAEHENLKPIVFVFDHDKKQIVDQVMGPRELFKNWGNNVFSFAIPIPEHRLEHGNISIEFYFSNKELGLSDSNGRRLFLTSEFVEKSGNLVSDPTIHIGNKGVLTNCTDPNKAKIIDTDVWDPMDNNIALTKATFAEYIATRKSPFDNLNFRPFQLIVDILETINSVSKPKISVYFPSLEEIMVAIEDLPHETQAAKLAKTIYDVIYMALEIFSIVSIRCYEGQITTGIPERYAKKSSLHQNSIVRELCLS